jgi:cyclopropane-fatty-acyl-phospholipid synthase
MTQHTAASRIRLGRSAAESGIPARVGRSAVVIDPARWPDVAAIPRGHVRAAIAARLLATAARQLPVRVAPAGRAEFGAGDPDSPVLQLRRPADFCRRVGAAGLIGFGESYMAGDWDCDDLAGLLTAMCAHIDTLVPPVLQGLRRAYVARKPADWDADEAGARRNAHQHYDLSNEMFALFLDETMTYSAALFDPGSARVIDAISPRMPHGGPDSGTLLATAQRRKVDRLLDATGVGPGCQVLEIGTGWGELAIRAAARGATVRSITLSAQQRALARARISAAGLSGRATVDLLDYREVRGQYDVIVSVEMIEAVAERYWADYFRALDRLLAPGGRIGLQAITMPHQRMLATRHTKTWILKYIFPGGLIPSVQAIRDNLATHTSLAIASRYDFGLDYARTLRLWRRRFTAAAADLAKLGFDEVFRRMWEFYLCYAEAGFQSGYLQVSQFQLRRDSAGAR